MPEKASSHKEHPLAGTVLCFTSVLPEQRTELSTVASQMGATHKYDLTSDVTHLIVGEVNSPKYKFVARERPDVIVLRPEWVEAVRQSWMKGGDTDIQKLEELYRLPTFAGLSICITGFEDMALRSYICNTAGANGAEFRKDLTKSVTHLVARNTEGEKYRFATQWNIKVVTIKWFSDSIERGMVLEETLYHPLLPPEQQGAGAWNKSVPVVKEKPSGTDSSNPSNPRPRKLRRMASAKLEHQNEGIWGDIVGSGFENPDPKGSDGNQARKNAPVPKKAAPVLQEAKSFASATPSVEPQSQRPREQVSDASANGLEGFLHGCFFFISGFSSKQASVLRQHLMFNGAQIMGSLSDFSHPDIPKTGHGLYIIVSHRTPRSEIPSTDDMAFECEIVTDMWLERCLDAKTLVSPESHVANTPVPTFPMPGFSGVKICSTGFVRIDLLHLSKLVALIGATYNEYMTSNATVLVCHDPRSVNQEKLRHAAEWNVPAVSADWIWDSIRAGQKKPFEPYLIKRQLSQGEGDKAVEKQKDSQTKRTSQVLQPKQGNTDKEAVEVKENTPDVPHERQPAQEQPPQHTEDDNSSRQDKQQVPQKRTFMWQSNSPSPLKEQAHSPAAADASSIRRQDSEQSGVSAAQTINGLLKQARAASSRTATDSSDQNDSNIRQRRRKPLLGRAPSLSSARNVSRASSIDTLNEDGCGSGLESADLSRTNSRSGPQPQPHQQQQQQAPPAQPQSISSLFSGSKFDFNPEAIHNSHLQDGIPDSDEEQEPPMTQLNYEDPDAVAMRQQFLRKAGKLVDEDTREGQAVVVGEMREVEDTGWGTGRRTRKSAAGGGKATTDGLEKF